MRYFIAFFISLFLCTGIIVGESVNKKGAEEIRILLSKGSLKEADKLIDECRVNSWSSEERASFYRSLVNIADGFYTSGNINKALGIKQLIKEKSPNTWEVYSRVREPKFALSLEFLNDSLKQIKSISGNFFSLYFLLRGLHKTFYISFLLVFFFWSLFLLTRYFNLPCHDLILEREGDYSKKKLLFIVAVILFPLIYLGGWAFYILPIVGFLYVYLDNKEIKLTTVLLFILVLFLMVDVFFSLVDRELQYPKLKAYLSLYQGKVQRSKESNKDNEYLVRKALFIYNNSKKEQKDLEKVRTLLSKVSPDYKSYVKSTLLGDLARLEGNYNEAIVKYNDAMQFGKERAKLGSRILSVIASMPNQEDKESMYKAFINGYPDLAKLKSDLGELENLQPRKAQIWSYILSFNKDSFTFGNFFKFYFKEFLSEPLTWMLVIFISYILFFNLFLANYGMSVNCSRCGRAVKSKRTENLLCDDCAQLFMMKDMAFLEAKRAKQNELNKKSYQSYLIHLTLGIVVPGFALIHRGLYKLYVFGAWLTLSMMLSNYYIGSIFLKLFGVKPLFLNIFTVLGIIFYLIFNLISLTGQDYEF